MKTLLFQLLVLCFISVSAKPLGGSLPIELSLTTGTNITFAKSLINSGHFIQKPTAGFSLDAGVSMACYKDLFVKCRYGFRSLNRTTGIKFKELPQQEQYAAEVKVSGLAPFIVHQFEGAISYRFKVKKIFIEPEIGFTIGNVTFLTDGEGVSGTSSGYYDSTYQLVITNKTFSYPPLVRRSLLAGLTFGFNIGLPLKFVQPFIGLKYQQGLLVTEKWKERVDLYSDGKLATTIDETIIYRGSHFSVGLGINVSVNDIVSSINNKNKKRQLKQLGE